jgi:thermostable 8-oxoguanine DNA glycosylase
MKNFLKQEIKEFRLMKKENNSDQLQQEVQFYISVL